MVWWQRRRRVRAQTVELLSRLGPEWAALMLRLTGIDIERCPVCQRGRLHVTQLLAPTSSLTRCVPLVDTS